jgi:hypothetical protein
MKLTRRKLATVLAAMLPSAAVVTAQQPPPAPPDDLLKTARERMQANAAALSTPPIPMATEPAFQFKA